MESHTKPVGRTFQPWASWKWNLGGRFIGERLKLVSSGFTFRQVIFCGKVFQFIFWRVNTWPARWALCSGRRPRCLHSAISKLWGLTHPSSFIWAGVRTWGCTVTQTTFTSLFGNSLSQPVSDFSDVAISDPFEAVVQMMLILNFPLLPAWELGFLGSSVQIFVAVVSSTVLPTLVDLHSPQNLVIILSWGFWREKNRCVCSYNLELEESSTLHY